MRSGAARHPAVLLGACALYPLVLVWWATRRGIGSSPDSAYYLYAAHSYASWGWLEAFGDPVVAWPPGLPIALGQAIRWGADGQTVALLVNLLSVVGLVLLTYVLATSLGQPAILALVSAAAVATSCSTVRVASMLWSEPAFTLCVLAGVTLSVRALTSPTSDRALAGAAVAMSAACVFRFAGAAFVAIPAVAAAWGARHRPRSAALRAVAFGALACVGLGLVLTDRLMSDTARLGDPSRGRPMLSVGWRIPQTLGGFVVPSPNGYLPIGNLEASSPSTLWLAGQVALGLALAALLAATVRTAWRRRDARVLLVAAAVALGWGVVVVASLVWGTDPPDERLLYPVWPMTVVILVEGARWLVRARRSSEGRAGRLHHPLTMVAPVLLVGVCFGVMVAQTAHREGIGYTSRAVGESAFVVALQRLPADGRGVATPDPWVAYWVSGRPSFWLTDRRIPEWAARGDVSYLVFFPDPSGAGPSGILEASAAVAARSLSLEPVDVDVATVWIYRVVGTRPQP